jgi:hypothetical protein
MDELESSLHDLRGRGETLWAISVETLDLVHLTADREGWSLAWRVGAGEIVGEADQDSLRWLTPAAGSSWVELTLTRGDERHTCRRWIPLVLEPLAIALSAETDLDDIGRHTLSCAVTASPRAPLALQWGAETGTVEAAPHGHSAVWEARPAGEHRIWVLADDGYRQAADTLTLVVANVPPRFDVMDHGDYYDDPAAPIGMLDLRGTDLNHDPLTLEVTDLDGLVLMEWATLDATDELQGCWRLLFDLATSASGWRTHRLRLSDGVHQVELDQPILVYAP